MHEQQIDCWAVTGADAIVIPTNGTVTVRGKGVMGRGVAHQAKMRYAPALDLQARLGQDLTMYGNHVGVLTPPHLFPALVTFPVKHEWHQIADLDLIAQSAKELRTLTETRAWALVVVPRPGCGNGRLSWNVVKPIVAPYLDARFLVVWQ